MAFRYLILRIHVDDVSLVVVDDGRGFDPDATLAITSAAQAAYAVSLAYRIRFYLHLNAREAMHLLELRTTPQGHPAYRVVGQDMHRLIAEQAGHRAVAAAMTHLTTEAPELERLAGLEIVVRRNEPSAERVCSCRAAGESPGACRGTRTRSARASRSRCTIASADARSLPGT